MGHRKVLVVGATGGIGGEMVRQLAAAGWEVQAMHRNPAQVASTSPAVTWLQGDAMNRVDVMAGAQGCKVIVHAVNPPGYRGWGEHVLPMLDNTVAAAIAQGATVVLPGTVYNFAPDTFADLNEDSVQQPLTRKGLIRAEMERRLQHATTLGARVIIVRAGDFFGPGAGNNWFTQGLLKAGRALRHINLPGAPGVGHQWAYLPDVARTMMRLLAVSETLPAWAVFHMRGHWDADGLQMADAIRRVVVRRGGREPVLRAFPWWLVRAASPFTETFREMLELRYLWQVPLRLRNDRLLRRLGEEPHTPLLEAVEATLHPWIALADPLPSG